MSPAITDSEIQRAVAAVPDPELPILTIEDLGILRAVEVAVGGRVRVVITPTYLGCPAIEMIAGDIRQTLGRLGVTKVVVTTTFSPPWSSDMVTAEGHAKLKTAGIAPPSSNRDSHDPVPLDLGLECPRCSSRSTRPLSAYGATSCTSTWTCRACREVFDHFRQH